MILDTHVAAWLYAGKTKIFPANVRDDIAQEALVISPMVILELQCLFEIGRVAENASVVIRDLSERIDLKVCTHPFEEVVEYAVTQTWTRDPFDRIIVAQAGVQSNKLITKDELIHDNYPYAVWSIP